MPSFTRNPAGLPKARPARIVSELQAFLYYAEAGPKEWRPGDG